MTSETATTPPVSDEAELARQWNEENERDAIHARLVRLFVAVALAVVAVLLVFLALYGWAFVVFGLAATVFAMYVDANGHVHEIRERPKNRLTPRLTSVLGDQVDLKKPDHAATTPATAPATPATTNH